MPTPRRAIRLISTTDTPRVGTSSTKSECSSISARTPQSDKKQLSPFTWRKFHRPREVTIARHEHKDVSVSLEGERRVQPEMHVHSLLVNVGFKV